MKIIKVNCRIAFQFAKTIEAVTGIDPLHMLCETAVGRRPSEKAVSGVTAPMCYNFEMHHFHDARILETPTRSAYAEIRMKYPEVRIRNLIHENARLSDFKHNPHSYRYCVLDMPGKSHEEIMGKYREVVSMLGYKFDTAAEPGEAETGVAPQPPRYTEGGSRERNAQPAIHQ